MASQREDFVAALTHELKAPLTGMRALTELLHEELVTDPEKKREYYASMLSECDRLGRLIENVIAAARLERGALKVVLEPISPSEPTSPSAKSARGHGSGARRRKLPSAPRACVRSLRLAGNRTPRRSASTGTLQERSEPSVACLASVD